MEGYHLDVHSGASAFIPMGVEFSLRNLTLVEFLPQQDGFCHLVRLKLQARPFPGQEMSQ